MYSRFLLLVIISSVVAIDQKHLSLLKSLCWHRLNLFKVATLVKHFQNKSLADDVCDHSVGFHFNREMCKSFVPRLNPDSDSRTISAFLSNGDKYLYVYVLNSRLEATAGDSDKEAQVVLKNMEGYFFRNWILDKNSLFVLWIKEKSIYKSKDSYNVRFSYGRSATPKTIKTAPLAKTTDEQIILKGVNRTKPVTITTNSMTSQKTVDRITIKDSYLIFCAIKTKSTYSLKYQNKYCIAVEENEAIRCECSDSTKHTVIFVLFLMWVIPLFLSIHPILEKFSEKKMDTTLYKIYHNCSEKNSRFKHMVLIRFTRPTADFDLRDVTIDVEFFTDNQQSIAPNHRFLAKVLDMNPITDIKLVMNRLTKMPELKRIQCSHSGKPEGKIFIVGVMTHSLGTDRDKDMKWHKMAKNVSRVPRQYNLHVSEPTKTASDPELKLQKYMNLRQISFTTLELILILFVVVLFIGLISTLFMKLVFIGSPILQILAAIVVTTVCGIAFLALYVLVYKYILLWQMKEQMRMNSFSERICLIVIRSFVIFSFVMTFLLSGYIIYYRNSDPGIVVFRWFAVVVFSFAVTAMVWNLFIHLVESKKRIDSESELTVNSASINDF